MRTSEAASKKVLAGVGLLVLGLGLLAVVAQPPAEATPLAPFIDLQEAGLTLDHDAAGLAGGFDATGVDLTVDVGGVVRFGLLYWSGFFSCANVDPCQVPSQPMADQEITFDGNALTGTLIGSEVEGTAGVHLSFFADVTSIVSAAGAGPQTFTVADGNLASDLATVHGAGLVVAFTDATDPDQYRVLIFDNGDFGDGDLTGDNSSIQPITFNHGAVAGPRTAEFFTLVGGGTAGGADSLTVGGASAAGPFDASDGAAYDLEVLSVPIPTNTATANAGVVTPAGGDELFWTMAGMRVPLEIDDTAEPTCSAVVAAGPPTVVTTTIEDDGSGLAEILVTVSQNADTVVPPFVVGTNDPVVVTSTRINQANPMLVEMRVTDVEGNQRFCDIEFPNTPPQVQLELTADPPTVVTPGAQVDFDVVITNPGTEDFVITALDDDILGDVSGNGSCTDAVGTILSPGDPAYTCTYVGAVNGAAGAVEVHTATVTVEDLVLNAAEDTDSDTETVTVTAQATTTSSTSTSSTTTPTTGASTTTTGAVGAGALSRTGSEPAPLTTTAGALFTAGGVALLLSARRHARQGA